MRQLLRCVLVILPQFSGLGILSVAVVAPLDSSVPASAAAPGPNGENYALAAPPQLQRGTAVRTLDCHEDASREDGPAPAWAHLTATVALNVGPIKSASPVGCLAASPD